MTIDEGFTPLVDRQQLGRLLHEHSDVWQMKLLNVRGFANFTQKRSLVFVEKQIHRLWQMGLLRADFVIPEHPIHQSGLLDIGFAQNGQHMYADCRVFQTSENAWLSAPTNQPADSMGVKLLFHPFRYFTLYKIGGILKSFGIHPYQALVSIESYYKISDKLLSELHEHLKSSEFATHIQYWDSIASLAILSEPSFYSQLIDQVQSAANTTFEQHQQHVKSYWDEVKRIALALGVAQITQAHRTLCIDAERLDANTKVHTILRLADGETREHVEGHLGGAMLLLTMAEIIRRTAEKTFCIKLQEEDQCGFGIHFKGFKEKQYGSERLFDDDRRAADEYLRSMGLDYSVRLRWYVEGDTEYGALKSVFARDTAIELVNLKGNVSQAGGKGVSFREDLVNNLRTGVFSFVTIDMDQPDNVRTVRKATVEGDICGRFFLCSPDFEFQNFTRDELEEVIWNVAQENGAHDTKRSDLHAAIIDARSGKELLTKARRVMPKELGGMKKGEKWGQLLAEYAGQRPHRQDSGQLRQIIEMIHDAIQMVESSYHDIRQTFRVDPVTGKLVQREQPTQPHCSIKITAYLVSLTSPLLQVNAVI